MRLKLVPLLLVIALTSCTFEVDVIETPTAGATVPPVESSTPTLAPTSVDIATSTPVPSSSATNTMLPASVGGPADPVYPIQFAPNGTYTDTIDSIKAGAGKTYSVRALKGQVMSVSLHQNASAEWTDITMRIIGADGTLLCMDECRFWRGALPATQDYYVLLTPLADASNFALRVAINPPGQANQYFLYDDPQGRYSLSYSDEFAPMLYRGEVTKFVPEFALQYIDTKQYVPTNLGEAYFLIGSSADSQAVATCTDPASIGAPEESAGNVTINGVSFVKTRAVGVGAGNIYEQTFFRTVHNGTCYEVNYFVHYGNIGNYTPGLVTEFDQDALMQKFDQTLSTLMFK